MNWLIILILICLPTNAYAQLCPAKEYTNAEICQAIFLAEGGNKTKYPYGIRSVTCETKEECKRVCLNTVRNNRVRFKQYGFKRHKTYLDFLASRYAPTTGNLRPAEKKLNVNWLSNVRYFLEKI